MTFLSSMDREFEGYNSCSQNDDCPAMTTSFLTVDTSGMSFDGDRTEYRGSISPENLTMSSRASNQSPITPANLHDIHATAIWAKHQYNDLWHHLNTDVDSFWPPSEDATMAHCPIANFPQHDLHMHPSGYFGLGKRLKPSVDPPLSRAVFANSIPQQEEHTVVDNMLTWPQKLEHAYPRTVAPNVTFQDIVPSPPATEFEPMTPMKHHRYGSSTYASSPLTRHPSSILTSQWVMGDGVQSSPVADTPSYCDQEDLAQMLSSSPDQQMKREGSSPTRNLTSKSGVDCEAVIPQNIFACSVPGCVDKNGGPKRFRRQEHKKRHEKTVHNKDTTFACWVQTGGNRCDKKFTRRDNLNSHLKKTHGSRKNNQRNSYVATLDEKSKYFDEKWRGPLTAHGLPVGHPRWPEVS